VTLKNRQLATHNSQDMDGVLVIDKPEGITSFGVVKMVKGALKAKKVGHAGTLDPFATGVLPLLINKATKIASDLLDKDKEYSATMKLGIETDTQDLTGKVVYKSPEVAFERGEIESVFKGFIGKIKQTPPAFSAIKYQGTPLYKWTRRGKKIPRKCRMVEVYSLKVKALDLPYVTFEIVCSKGTYIRTLCTDIGRLLGCGAHLTRLRRLRCGRFTLEHAISLKEVRPLSEANLLGDRLISIEEALRSEEHRAESIEACSDNSLL